MTHVADWWAALVTFERRDPSPVEFIPDHCQGAVGWMAIHTPRENQIRDLIESALSAVNLRLVAIESPSRVKTPERLESLDTHLAANVASLEPGKSVVWGTIRTYVADGEA
jgi:hypothetical protein